MAWKLFNRPPCSHANGIRCQRHEWRPGPRRWEDIYRPSLPLSRPLYHPLNDHHFHNSTAYPPPQKQYLPRTNKRPCPGGAWGRINRLTAGSRFNRDLPKGEHFLQLHSMGAPNCQKLTIFLEVEELLAAGDDGAKYDAWMIPIGDGLQSGSGFVEDSCPAVVGKCCPDCPRV
mmetsp:Transcript_31227/g.75496  ORF Transcript_31227/g.75496 Transcript_31227/m.75496 type:complete len:173 (-) Transcript_31227:112-630(-)